MKLENQVCSLELAKKLKELGVKQESLFYWVNENYKQIERPRWEITQVYSTEPYPRFSSFTVSELGEMLPNTEDCISRREQNEKEWRCGNQIEKTEADARAKMLIYLLENNLIKTN